MHRAVHDRAGAIRPHRRPSAFTLLVHAEGMRLGGLPGSCALGHCPELADRRASRRAEQGMVGLKAP
eukprot:5866181-Alexandrium_andersonii.AAC.1